MALEGTPDHDGWETLKGRGMKRGREKRKRRKERKKPSMEDECITEE